MIRMKWDDNYNYSSNWWSRDLSSIERHLSNALPEKSIQTTFVYPLQQQSLLSHLSGPDKHR